MSAGNRWTDTETKILRTEIVAANQDTTTYPDIYAKVKDRITGRTEGAILNQIHVQWMRIHGRKNKATKRKRRTVQPVVKRVVTTSRVTPEPTENKIVVKSGRIAIPFKSVSIEGNVLYLDI